MSKTIPWQKYNLKMEFDGYEVEAIITYWAKDYYIDIIKPCQKRIFDVTNLILTSHLIKFYSSI